MGMNISTGDLIQQQHRGNWKAVTLADEVAVGAGGDMYTVGEDVSLYTHMSFEVITTAACVVYYQTSSDNINWHEPLIVPSGTDDVTDVVESADVDTEKRNIKVTRRCRYIRAWVHATGASTVTVVLFAQM